MDELHFIFQTTGKSIEDVNLEKTLETNGFEKHHISILNRVGSKKKLFHLSVYQKEELRASIESIVKRKSLEKEHPQLVKPKSEDIKVIDRLRDNKVVTATMTGESLRMKIIQQQIQRLFQVRL